MKVKIKSLEEIKQEYLKYFGVNYDKEVVQSVKDLHVKLQNNIFTDVKQDKSGFYYSNQALKIVNNDLWEKGIGGQLLYKQEFDFI